MFKRLLSFIIPVNIYKKNSGISKTLEVTWNNGQLVLDSQNTNYSYGSLQRVLRKALKSIGFDVVREMKHILVLGVGGGSVIKTLSDEIGFTGKITGVEIDPEVIEMAETYFKLSKIPNFEILQDDAFEFVLKTKERYNLIIVDIFRDTEMPQFLFESFFSNRIGFLLTDGGYMVFNTMTLTKSEQQRNQIYLKNFDPTEFEVSLMPKVEHHNEVIIAKKR